MIQKHYNNGLKKHHLHPPPLPSIPSLPPLPAFPVPRRPTSPSLNSITHEYYSRKELNGRNQLGLHSTEDLCENAKSLCHKTNNTSINTELGVVGQSVRKRRLNGYDCDATPNKMPAPATLSNATSNTKMQSPSKESSKLISHSIEKLTNNNTQKNSNVHCHISSTATGLTCDESLDNHSENMSAFRKVEKSPKLSKGINSSSSPSQTSPHRQTHDYLSPNNKQIYSPKSSHYSSSSPSSSSSSSSSSIDMSSSASPVDVLNSPTLPHHTTLPAQLAHTTAPSNLIISRPNSTSSTTDEPSTSAMTDRPRPPLTHNMGSSSSSSSSSALTVSKTAIATPSLMGVYMPRLPMVPQPHLGLPRPGFFGPPISRAIQIPHSAFPDQIPPGLLEICRATIPTVGPLTESFAANIRKMDMHGTLSKQALFADRHISTLGFLKSTNPMVEKLLQTTNPTMLSSPINALNLSQNWCAKCNATFRMTSDLVYHMR